MWQNTKLLGAIEFHFLKNALTLRHTQKRVIIKRAPFPEEKKSIFFLIVRQVNANFNLWTKM